MTVDADARHNRRHQHPDVAERSPAAALSRSARGEDGQVRHHDEPDDKRDRRSADDREGGAMDTQHPIYAFTGMDDLPPRDDDDELISVGEPIWDVVNVEAVGPMTLAVRFEDGLEGRVRFELSYLKGVFAKLLDPTYFHQVGLAHGAVSWPNEQPDMAPDTMYDRIKADGEWVLR